MATIEMTIKYPALVEWDANANAYGVVFPDLNIGAMGDTLEQAMVNAESMLGDYVFEMEKEGWPFADPSALESVEVPKGNTLVSVPLVRPTASHSTPLVANAD